MPQVPLFLFFLRKYNAYLKASEAFLGIFHRQVTGWHFILSKEVKAWTLFCHSFTKVRMVWSNWSHVARSQAFALEITVQLAVSLWLTSRYDVEGGHHVLPCAGWGGAPCGRTWLVG